MPEPPSGDVEEAQILLVCQRCRHLQLRLERALARVAQSVAAPPSLVSRDLNSLRATETAIAKHEKETGHVVLGSA